MEFSETDRLIDSPPVVAVFGQKNHWAHSIFLSNENKFSLNGDLSCSHEHSHSHNHSHEEEEDDGHCHGASSSDGIDKVARKKLLIASILCLFFMTGEIIGGAMAGSLAIMTDAAHLLTDFASFMISLLAIYLASRPATKTMSFGWHRAEVVGALVSVLLIWVVTGILVYLAVLRCIHRNFKIEGDVMLITSAVGVAVNLVMAFTLHQHGHSHGGSSHGHSHGGGGTDSLASTPGSSAAASPAGSLHSTPTHGHPNGQSLGVSKKDKSEPKENINVRAAFIHVIGDFVQSAGVMVAAFIIYFHPELKLADPICTFIFSVLVLITTLNILRDTMNVLMEGTPRGLDFNVVKASLYEIDGVVEVHNLRIWSLTVNKIAMSAHLAVDKNKDAQRILKRARRMLRNRFQVHDVTIQLEDYVDEMADCPECQEPRD